MIVDLPKPAVPEQSAAQPVAATPGPSSAPASPSLDPFRPLDAQYEKARKQRRKRALFHRALFRASLLVWAALCVFFVTTQFRSWRERALMLIPPLGAPFGDDPILERVAVHPKPELQGAPVMCDPWKHHTYDRASFQTYFPRNTTSIFLNSFGGPSVSGTLRVWSDESSRQQIQVRVEARSRYKNIVKAQADGDVCLMSGARDGSYGISLSHDHPIDDEIDITISLVIPTNMTLPHLSTFLPRFKQVIGMPSASDSLLKIDSLYLDGPVTQLKMDLAEIRDLAIESEGAFFGSLTVSESLSIRSTASSIDANVTLAYRGWPFRVAVETSHAPIDMALRVVDADDTLSDAFSPIPLDITATSNHAPVSVAVDYASPNIVLGLNVTTRLAPAYIQVPPVFEGSFDLFAASAETDIIESELLDPLSIGRLRRIDVSTSASRASGSVSWLSIGDINDSFESAQTPRGHVQGTTQLAKAVLDLTGSKGVFGAISWRQGCIIGR